MHIRSATVEDARILADIVSNSNKDVALQFGLTMNNAPKHPSFYTEDWVVSDFTRGEEYFLFEELDKIKGCVAFEQPDPDTAYLNRLSVLPDYRHKGIGTTLVNHILEYAARKGTRTVSIGIIAEHAVLNKWYGALGFLNGELRKFDHLPFNVRYMRYEL